MMDHFLYDQFLGIFGYLLIAVFFPSSAAPIKCPINKFWNPAIERCDSCSIYCGSNNPNYLSVCQRKCASVYHQLMSATGTTQTTRSTLQATFQSVTHFTSHQNETSSGGVVMPPVAATFSTPEIAVICLGGVVGAVLVIMLIVKLISRRNRGGLATLSCLGGSKERLSTPVQAESDTGSQELSSLSTNQSLENTVETQPLNAPEAPEQLLG
ncbi:uncharacterized protein LOC135487976 [Lineus longissimus]|uniref:uncharacterized protein LOC135487976 n=1 Tax=Lineus longissimus TaxID=88925 RepID=UPI002B4EDE3B